MSRTHPPRRNGFTLIEMVVGLAVVSVLLAGMSSAIVLATHALPSNKGPAAATVASAAALHTFRDDLRAATEMPAFDANSVTLHLPDRDGDGRPEVVTYAWAGTAGSPLTRVANGNPAVTILDNVESLALDYVCGKQDTVFPGASISSGEIELSSHDPVTGSQNFMVDSDDLIGFRFTPSLPSGATTYRVTRIMMKTHSAGASSGKATFDLTGWDTGTGPDSAVIQSVNVAEPDLAAHYAWYEIDFGGAGPFNAGDAAAVTVQDTGSGQACRIRWDDMVSPPNAHESSDGGTAWTVHPTAGAVDHYVYGTYEGTGDDWTLTRQRVTAVEIALVHSDAATTTHRLNVPLPNAPEAATAMWDADFEADPTTLDADGDGVADWSDSGVFDTAALNDGRWEVTDTLFSEPSNVVLDEPFVLDLWLEDTQSNAMGGGVRVRFDQSGGQQGCAVIEIALGPAGQVVTVDQEIATDSYEEKINQTVAAGSNVRVTLAVDPANDTVGVMVNGEVAGSYGYTPFASTNGNLIRPFTDINSGVFLEHLRLTTGGAVAITPGAYTSGSGGSGSGDTSGTSGTGGTSSAMAALDDSGTTESSTSSGNWWENLFSR